MDKEEFLSHVLGAEETLFHISFSILHNEQDCSDAVQEAILKAYSCLDKLRDEKYFKTWIVRILINECYGILRKKRRFVEFEEAVESDRAVIGNYVKEEYIDLYQAIEKLGEKEKICIILFYLEDYSVEQIAEITRVPAGTVKSRLNRGRSQLKGLLSE